MLIRPGMMAAMMGGMMGALADPTPAYEAVINKMKDDVEKSVPPKTETIIDCPMVLFQRLTYRAIYDRNMKSQMRFFLKQS